MKRIVVFALFSLSNFSVAQFVDFNQHYIKDSEANYAISYASISFGDGQGIFADDEGMFVFNKKLYADVDSIFITALGYSKLALSTESLPEVIFLAPKIDELSEVLITVALDRKFKTEKLKPYLDDDYYHCWLPTIESEIAVLFNNSDTKDRQISSVLFPLALESRDWKKRKRSNADKRKFSTLFKVVFYNNNKGVPGQPLLNETIVFRATEKDGDMHNLNVEDYNITVPKSGFFVSLQVLGYTDANGKLLPNKKYKEIKSGNRVVKIPTNFRPLLPFTNKMTSDRTFIKRVFINNNEWKQFRKGNGFKSNLLDEGLTNYGIGVSYKVFKEQ
ncbi:hypothetical protein RM697_11500 [Ichthyenterobacterium sp. W332]|uniref:Carboxypeptidase-like regulatory domain-containing protein n=1 Tax=Microcosmobacter mediterraneus TaxID=3075607 RepID=A0ABU2YM95_9FLAO|nr:hypothetical protein [Ichthyenterobacterium sp. W332]MDT0559280.1 hypothetical protein [Ichthyenterobacterium sp. W332]